MMYKVRKLTPQRTSVAKKCETYGQYKTFLRNDFNRRCGYCDCEDHFVGGSRGFQIDHFKPKKHFPNLETEYTNLVYSCPYCNRAKWDKWVEPDGFIDPCDSTYEKNLFRNAKGQIKALTIRGEFIHKELNLRLFRHELIWMIEKLYQQMKALKVIMDTIDKSHVQRVQILEQWYEISNEYIKYTDLHHSQI